MRIFQQKTFLVFTFRIQTLRTLDQDHAVTPLVDRHLTVDTPETILLDLCYPPDQIVAGLTEGWLVEVGLHELVTFYKETSLHFVSPAEDVLGRRRKHLLLFHADREGDGATRGETLD